MCDAVARQTEIVGYSQGGNIPPLTAERLSHGLVGADPLKLTVWQALAARLLRLGSGGLCVTVARVRGESLREILAGEDQHGPVHNVDTHRHMAGRQRGVPGDHHQRVVGGLEHSERRLTARLHGAREDGKAGEHEAALSSIPADRPQAGVRHLASEPLVGERDDSGTARCEALVGRHVARATLTAGQQREQHLWSSLGNHPVGNSAVAVRLCPHDGTHPLEGRAEVEAVEDLNLLAELRREGLPGGHEVSGVAPANGREGSLLEGVADHLPANDHQRLACRHHPADLYRDAGLHVGGEARLVCLLLAGHHVHVCGEKEPLKDKVVAGEGPGLVKAAGVHLAGERDAEGLSAEDPHPVKGHDRLVDGNGELHGKLRRDDGGDDHGAIEQQLVPRPLLVLQAVVHHIG
mmetsp:Transcript_35059/g.99383  ORF Transcript_35059/g.99383 Transcript_35059/m.99383 type:complete len:407 (+) Transcript_35059:1375-2595(+)